MTRNTRTLWLAAAVALAMPSMAAMANDGTGGGMGGGYGHPMNDMHGHCMHGCSDRHAYRHRMDRMADKLGLTDAQKKQMQAVRDESRRTMQPLIQQKRKNMRRMWMLDPDSKDYLDQIRKLAAKQADLTEKMIIAGAEARAKFHAILTRTQKEKLKQMREKRRKAYEDRHGKGMDSRGMGGMRGGN